MTAIEAVQQKLLLCAAAEGKRDLCRRLLLSSPGSDPALLEARNPSGATPLMLAARFGHRDVVQALLRAGADPNATSDLGNTATHWASMDGHLDIVQDLGDDLLACRNANGDSPLMWASAGGHDAVVAFIIDRLGDDERRHRNRDGINAVMCAAMGGYAGAVARLLDGADGALVDAQDANGNTALHLAVRGGHAACVHAVLARGPDLHLADWKARSVLDLVRQPDADQECRAAVDAFLEERSTISAALQRQLQDEDDTEGALDVPSDGEEEAGRSQDVLTGDELGQVHTAIGEEWRALGASLQSQHDRDEGNVPATPSDGCEEPGRVGRLRDELIGDVGRPKGQCGAALDAIFQILHDRDERNALAEPLDGGEEPGRVGRLQDVLDKLTGDLNVQLGQFGAAPQSQQPMLLGDDDDAPSEGGEEPGRVGRLQDALDELVGDVGRELGLAPEHCLGLDLDELSASQLDVVGNALDLVAGRVDSARRRLEQQVVQGLGAQVVSLTARLDQLTSRFNNAAI